MRPPRIAAVSFAAAPVVLAHVAISLVVLAPRHGATIPPDSELVVLAQRTLGGVGKTTFTVQVDGHLLDPRTGRRAAAGGASAVIAVGERATIPLRGLAPGRHHAEINYRPDVDERARAATVEFEVAPGSRTGASTGERTGRPGPAAVIAGAAALLLAAGVLLVTRAGRRAAAGAARS